MSVPNRIFIDTSILDEQNYNFDSSALAPFIEAVRPRQVILLLPDPTEREIRRHIRHKSQDVLKALQEAKRRAPFLRKWKEWPIKKGDLTLLQEIQALANKDLEEFFASMSVERLGYDGIDLKQVMDWYDRRAAPFGEGKKQKEFPDALALAAVVAYARKQQTSVAVISRDSDFHRACEDYAELLFYPDLPTITEAFIAGDERVQKVKELVAANSKMLEQRIAEDFEWLDFSPEEEPNGDVDGVQVAGVQFYELRVVSLGSTECSVAFFAKVNYSAHVQYDDPRTAIVDSSEGVYSPLHRKHGIVCDWTEITGMAKIRVSPSWDTILEVTFLKIDDSSVVVTEEPPLVD